MVSKINATIAFLPSQKSPADMTPEEIINLLIANYDQPDLLNLIEKFRPHLTMDVLEAGCQLTYSEMYRNAYYTLQWLEKILIEIAEIIGTQEAKARVIWVKGNTFSYLNRYQEALNCYKQIQPFYQERGELLKVAGMQINQSRILCELGQYHEALTLAKEAEVLCLTIGEPAEVYLANLKSALGWIFEETGDSEMALSVYDEARLLYRKQGVQTGVARINLNQAHLLRSLDQFDKAKALLAEARAIWTEVEYHQSIARVDLNLGTLAYKQGHYQEALHYLEAAYVGFQAVPLPIEVANVNLERSFVYRSLDLIQEMMTLATTAEKIFRQSQMHREHVLCLVNMAMGYWQLHLPQTAANLLASARRKLYRQGAWWKLWLVDTDRAQLALESGQVETAWRIARRTENQVKPSQHPSLAARLHLLLARCLLAQPHPDISQAQARIHQARDLAHTYHLAEVHIQAYYLLGTILAQLGQYQPAWAEVQKAIQACERLRLYLSQDELQVGFMANKLPIYEAYVQLTHHLVSQQQFAPAQLLATLNLAQTAPLPHTRLDTAVSTLTPEEQTELAELRQQWRWFQTKLETADQTTTSAEDHTHTRQKRHQIELALADLMRRQRLRHTAVSGKATDPAPDTPEALLAAIQQQLRPRESVLHYYVVDDQFQALFITPTTIHPIPNLVSTKTLQRLLQSWRFHLQHILTTAAIAETGQKMAQAYLTRLYQVLIRPFASYLQEPDHLYLIIPPGWHELPLAALFDGQQYLVESHQLTYLSTPEALLTRQQRQPHPATTPPHALILGYSENGRLPHTLTEAHIIAQTLAPHWHTQQVQEEEATLDTFRAACQESHLLHLATHAVFRPDNPYFSWIRLADIRLTLADLYDIHLPQHPLVVLSACETGRGQARGGGLLGMGRGFLAAGASGLIVTLWQISDTHSAHLMQHFYQTFTLTSHNNTTATILAQAQRQAIAAQEHPFYWAGFIFMNG